MKKRLFAILFACALLCFGCEKGGNEDFTQKTLPAPDRMEVKNSSATVEYLPDSEAYQKIFAALQPNWWKTTGDNKEDSAPEEALFMAESPEQLRFQSHRTYAESGDTFLYFYYENEPLTWVNPTGPASQIHTIVFLLPNRVESQEHVRSCFMTLESDSFADLHGSFAYYFPPEVAASFWDFVKG